MSEAVRREQYPNPVPYDIATLTSFSQQVEALGAKPPGEDIRTAAFTRAVLDEIYDVSSDSKFRRQLVDNLIEGRRGQDDEDSQVTYKPNKLLRSCMKFAKRSDWQDEPDNPRFADDFDKPKSWRKLFAWIVNDQSRADEFAYDLAERDVATNVPQRYNIVPFIINSIKEAEPNRFEQPISLLDVGSSQNLGLIKLASRLPFQPVTLYRGRKDSQTIDTEATDRYNCLVKLGINLKVGWGVDRVDPSEFGAEEWTRACDLYPSEYLNPDRTEELNALYTLRSNVANVHFNKWDIEKIPVPGQLDFAKKSIDLGFGSNVLYIVAANKRRSAVENILSYIRPNGLFVWLEAATAGKHNVPRFFANPNAKPYQFRAYVIDKAARHPKPEELVRFKNGRCVDAILGSLGLSLTNYRQEAAAP